MPLIGNPLNKLARSITLSSAIALALTAGLASPALADTATGSSTTPTATTQATASTTVKGGYLSETTDNTITLTETTLDGKNVQISTGTTNWSFTDARGTGATWALTVDATDFTSTTEASSQDTHARTIAVGNLSLVCSSLGTVRSGSDYVAPTCSPTTLSKAGPQTVITAVADKKGTYTFAPTFTLQIPVNAYRSNYKSDMSTLIPYVSTVTYTLG
jgi:hypothetical protein